MPVVEFWLDGRGRAPVRDYIDALRAAGRSPEVASIVRHIELIEDHGVLLGMPHARMISRTARLYELRPGNHRIAFAMNGEKCVLLHAWRKTSQQLDVRARDLSLNRLTRLRRSKT